MRTPQPLPIVLCLTALIDDLFEAVCARYGVFPIRGPLARFLWKRFARIKLLFANLAARIAAGQNLSPRPLRPRGTRAARRPRDEEIFRINRWVNPKFGWLCRVASGTIGASAFAYSLREILATDPDMRAMLAATPATARILRPLCWMLGVALPAAARQACPGPTPAEAAVRSGAIAMIPPQSVAPAPTAPRRAPLPPDPREHRRPGFILRAA